MKKWIIFLVILAITQKPSNVESRVQVLSKQFVYANSGAYLDYYSAVINDLVNAMNAGIDNSKNVVQNSVDARYNIYWTTITALFTTFPSLGNNTNDLDYHETQDDLKTGFKSDVEDKATELKSNIKPYITDVASSYAAFASDIAQRIKRVVSPACIRKTEAAFTTEMANAYTTLAQCGRTALANMTQSFFDIYVSLNDYHLSMASLTSQLVVCLYQPSDTSSQDCMNKNVSICGIF